MLKKKENCRFIMGPSSVTIISLLLLDAINHAIKPASTLKKKKKKKNYLSIPWVEIF